MTASQIIEKFFGGLQPILADIFQAETCLIEIIQLSNTSASPIFSSSTWLGKNRIVHTKQAEHFTAMMTYQLKVAIKEASITQLPNADHLNLTGRAERLYRRGDGSDWVVGVVSTAPANISEIIATTVLAFLSGIQTLLRQHFETSE